MIRNDIFITYHQLGLRFIGVWPGVTNIAGFTFIIGWSTFVIFFSFWNITVVYNDLNELMDNFVSTIGTIMGLLKLTTLRSKRSSLILVINKMFEDWSGESKKLVAMNENLMRSKLLSKSIIVLYNAMHFTYCLKAFISYALDAVKDRKYLAAATFPFDGKVSPMYEVIFVSQFITAYMCFNIHALIEGLLASSVLHACSKMEIVRQEIIKFSNIIRSKDNTRKVTLAALRNLTQLHVKFIDFAENVQDVFSFVAFFHIFFLTLVQVLSGYMFIDVLERGEKSVNLIHYATLTIAFLVSAGYYCVAGEYLMNQSEIIYSELYNCFWYEFRISEQKAITFMLMKAQKPVNLTFGKFDNLSLVYLTKIMKTSFSYLSLVRAVR